MTLEDAVPVAVEGRIKIPYRWPAGKLGTHFLAALRDEAQILGLRCPACRRVHVPPRPNCPRCGGTMGEWVRVGPGGRLVSWTRRGETVFALVRLDGADTDLVHVLLNPDRSLLVEGARLGPVYKLSCPGGMNELAGFAIEIPPARLP